MLCWTKLSDGRETVHSYSSQITLFDWNQNYQGNIALAIRNVLDVIPIFKKNERSIKENYRPVSILPIFSNIFEKILHDQTSAYFANILSKNKCGFRKGYSSQHCLVAMIEKWKKSR